MFYWFRLKLCGWLLPKEPAVAFSFGVRWMAAYMDHKKLMSVTWMSACGRQYTAFRSKDPINSEGILLDSKDEEGECIAGPDRYCLVCTNEWRGKGKRRCPSCGSIHTELVGEYAEGDYE